MMHQNELPQKILPAASIALPEEHQNFRGANLFAGMQFQMGQRHSSPDVKLRAGVGMFETRRPFARPTNRHHRAFVLRFNIEKGQELAGGSSASGLQTECPRRPALGSWA